MNSTLNENVAMLFELVDQIVELPDSAVNDQTMEVMRQTIESAFSYDARENFIRKQIDYLYQQNLNKISAIEDAQKLGQLIGEIVNSYEGLEGQKKEMVELVTSKIASLALEAAERYRGVEKKIYFQKLNPNAKLPTYAHQDDACADLYIPEEIVVPANARGFKVGTGLAGAIPDGWEVKVRPRSGMSMKTPLRISNAEGTIDAGYLNEWCVLFDNLSNEDYTISAGDRVAQVALKPVYYFCGEEVDDVHNIKQTERDMSGFGDSGK